MSNFDDDTDQDEGSLPIELSPLAAQFKIKLPEPLLLDDTANIDSVRKEDMKMYNMQLQFLYASWSAVQSMREMISLQRLTFEFYEKRRAILGMEYGVAKSETARQMVFEPLP